MSNLIAGFVVKEAGFPTLAVVAAFGCLFFALAMPETCVATETATDDPPPAIAAEAVAV